MIKTFTTLFLMALFLSVGISVSHAADDEAAPAEEEKAEEAEPEPEKDPLVEAEEKAMEKTHGMLMNLVTKLSPQEQKHFFVTYNNYNLIGTTKIVRNDVEGAIKKCGENNPDMKDDLDTRFEAWDGELQPVLKEAQANLDNMVIAQDYAKKREITKIFDSIDETRKRTDARFDKVPVTTPEACAYLLGKMDETQANLLALLRSTLVSFPQVAPDVQLEPSEQEQGEDQADEEKVEEEDSPEEL